MSVDKEGDWAKTSWTGTSAFDLNLALAESRQWIEDVCQTKFSSPDFAESTKNGVLLCRLINQIKPGLIRKIHEKKLTDFKCRENIAEFNRAARKLGLKDTQTFVDTDLIEGKRLRNVSITLYWLGRAARAVHTYKGPQLDLSAWGAKLPCSRCNKGIDKTEKPVVTLTRAFHPACAKCDKCAAPISAATGYAESDNHKQILCIPCSTQQQSASCFTCGSKLPAGAPALKDKKGNPICGECTCHDCAVPLKDGFYDIDRHRYCEPCAHKHGLDEDPEADHCTSCGIDLRTGQEVAEIDGQLFCLGCVCDACNAPLHQATAITLPTGKKICPECACFVCHKPITGQFAPVDGHKVCKPCLDAGALCDTCHAIIPQGAGNKTADGKKKMCDSCSCVSCHTPIVGKYVDAADGAGKICKPCAEKGVTTAAPAAAAHGHSHGPGDHGHSHGPGGHGHSHGGHDEPHSHSHATAKPTPAAAPAAAKRCAHAGGCAKPVSKKPSGQDSEYCSTHAGEYECAKCHLDLSGAVVQVGPTKFHQKCFSCGGCGTDFSGGQKVHIGKGDGVPLCGGCHDAGVKTCAKCAKKVSGGGVEAIGKTYHSECFSCVGCATRLRDSFVEQDGLPFCDACASHSPDICVACSLPLQGPVTEVYGGMYHKGCFKCARCKESLTSSYFPFNSLPHCEPCVRFLGKDQKCVGCNTYLEGACVSTHGQGYHPRCFTCSECKSVLELSGDAFKWKFSKVFCHGCYDRKYPAQQPAAAEPVYTSYHFGPRQAGFTVDQVSGEKVLRLLEKELRGQRH